MTEIWFWQRIVTPHMAALVTALAARGVAAHYIAERAMSAEREAMGWRPVPMAGVNLHLCDNDRVRTNLIDGASSASIHVCQGLRGNGGVTCAQRLLARRGLQQWVVMESVNDNGWRRVLKRFEYRRLFAARRESLTGVLATGYRTPVWVMRRGVPPERVFPFAYFLKDVDSGFEWPLRDGKALRVIFVGRLVPQKRVDLLIGALASLAKSQFELWIVGSGPLESQLQAQARRQLGEKVKWLGTRSSTEISGIVAGADCLVLPSRHDGWGAVVSEALMVGTPAICSDACGSAGVVCASGAGGVFANGDIEHLRTLLAQAIERGPVTPLQRRVLAGWAQCLGATRGADYLLEILATVAGHDAKPPPPWSASPVDCTARSTR